MSPKDLVVFLDQYPGHGQRLAFAVSLAKRWQAHLIATFVTQPLALHPHAAFAVGTGLSDMLAEYQADTEAARAGTHRIRSPDGSAQLHQRMARVR